MQSYKDLIVWQKSIDMVPQIYQLLKHLPREEKYAMADQIRRAVVSVPANIAEGQARQHKKEFLQFLGIAKGSLAEVHTLLIIAHRLNYMNNSQLLDIEAQVEEISKMLNALMRSLTN